jgi:hypothetical protein
MSKLWGPLGWMTLHSVSFIYPVNPSEAEKRIAKRFIDLFEDTISCPSCKGHFRNLKILYISMFPDYLDSRKNFALFIFRAHNTVNKRLDKPRPSTVAQCLATIKNATVHTSLANFRQAYLSYLIRNWSKENSGDGMMMIASVREMIKINNEYWSPREIAIPELEEADVLLIIERSNVRIAPTGRIMSTSVGFKGGKLQLGRM